ncbi:unnamed protein product [Rotaria magnacalcarata]|uniref:Uncharacterized protein n=1 Tax=Rotaria magnacalcarata TaxID=392030 RepID=A0A816PT56_9BILA|nr:unnamed protein product [Rotaria magnacalcarata]
MLTFYLDSYQNQLPQQLRLLQRLLPQRLPPQRLLPQQLQLLQRLPPQQLQLLQRLPPRQRLLPQPLPPQRLPPRQLLPLQLQLLQRLPPRPLQLLQRLPPRPLQLLQQLPPRPLQLLQQLPPRPLQLLQQHQQHQLPQRLQQVYTFFNILFNIPSKTTATTAIVVTPSTATCSSTVATSCTTATSIVATCQSYEVSWNGHCYYLDGSSGTCATGYSLSTNAVLTCISTQFAGKTYASAVSGNCCVWTADTYECYGFGSNCNSAGPFNSGPTLGGAGCTNAQNHYAGQLTFCGNRNFIKSTDGSILKSKLKLSCGKNLLELNPGRTLRRPDTIASGRILPFYNVSDRKLA